MNFLRSLGRAGVSGSAAAVTSGVAAAALARNNGHTPFASLNAVTHCLWPDEAYRQEPLSTQYTLTGAAIHLGSSIFWGAIFEMFRGKPETQHTTRDCGAAAATAALAYVVDYHVVPERVTPGFEAHIPKRAFPIIYAALGIGLFLASTVTRQD